MTYEQFTKNIKWGQTTAFVYKEIALTFDSPNRYNYVLCEINENVFANAPKDGYEITGIDDFPVVKEVIIDNFLEDWKPAAGMFDEGYKFIKRHIESGEAKIGWWHEPYKCGSDEYKIAIYMLILPTD